LFKISRVLRLFLLTSLIGMALVAPAAVSASHTAPDYTVESVPGSGDNDAPFWEAFLATNEGGTWVCVKTNLAQDPVLTGEEDAVIIKAATTNYVWIDPHAGTFSAPENSTSHYFICDQTVADVVIDPDGEVGGPCADPAYYGIFDNTASDVAVKFRFRWYTNYGLHTIVKWVPAGEVFRTVERWAKPGTLLRVAYWDGDSWVTLDRETAGKGRYPACPYTRGFSTDPIGTFESDLRNDNF
jgi:hypothetical protein